MLEGLVKKLAMDFDVGNIAKAAKASKEAKIAEIGADIELLTKQSWKLVIPSKLAFYFPFLTKLVWSSNLRVTGILLYYPRHLLEKLNTFNFS